MKKLLITALALSAGLSACTSEKEAGGEDATSQNTEAPKAQLASFKVAGMT